MSLPEYQLSFQLKMYESIQNNESEVTRQFLSVQNWQNSNMRGVFDESDAILQPKYQLIYTVGNQLTVDGGVQRWCVVQALLKRLPHHMKTLRKLHGGNEIEIDDEYVKNGHIYGAGKVDKRQDIFTPCRILNESIYPNLKKAIIKDILANKLNIDLPAINPNTKQRIKEFFNQQNTLPFEMIFEHFSTDAQNVLLILNGLLQFDVLKLMLTKRWRVNYGVNKNGHRKMAVPFRAKDIAADRTEFGHPDVAIGLTQLSYYYSGVFL